MEAWPGPASPPQGNGDLPFVTPSVFICDVSVVAEFAVCVTLLGIARPDHRVSGQLQGMDKFLEKYNLPRVNYEKTENMNKSITSKKTESLIENFPTKNQDQMSPLVNWAFYHSKKH